MTEPCDSENRAIHDLAKSFWPEFKALCMKKKIIVLARSLWYRCVGWRDRKSDNPFFWAIKSFLKGFDWKFISCLALGVIVAEIPFVMELVNCDFDFHNVALLAPMRAALPALLGMVLLDYLLEPDLSRTILFPALLVMVLVAFLGYYFGFTQPHLNGTYVVTGCVILLSWFIKVGDRRMIDTHEVHDDARKVLPEKECSVADVSTQSKVWQGKKTIILIRPGV